MSWHFRCNRCRGRNVMPRHWRDYKRPKRCKHCGHERFYVDKERVDRKACFCDGAYHWIAHRPGSPMCLQNPQWLANRARRHGETDDVVARLLDAAMSNAKASVPLPGVEEASPVTKMSIGVVGMLARPSRLLEADQGTALEVWITQHPGALPVVALKNADPLDQAGTADLRERYLDLQRIGTPVLARGFGISPAVVDGRECLRIGLTSYVGVVPAETRERIPA